MFAEHFANEAMILQIQKLDQWSYYQSKGIKANLVSTRIELLTVLGKTVGDKDRQKLERVQGGPEKHSESGRGETARVGGPTAAAPRAGPKPDHVPNRHRRGRHLRVDEAEEFLAGLVGAGHRRRHSDRLRFARLTL